MKKIVKVALFLIAVIIITSIIGCSKNASSPGYVLEDLNKRGISFSFEYPDKYKKGPSNPFGEESDTAAVVGEIYTYASNDTISNTRISIQLWNPTTEIPNAKARLDYFANNTKNAGKDPVISERSPLQVATINGEKLVYAFTMEEVTSIPNRLTGWVAAFDYKGQIGLLSSRLTWKYWMNLKLILTI